MAELVDRPDSPQDVAHAEQIVRDTADALTPRPTLGIYQPGSTTSACLDDANPQSAQGPVVVSRTYWLRGIPRTSNTAIGEQVLRLWKQKGWVINSTKGIGASQPQIRHRQALRVWDQPGMEFRRLAVDPGQLGVHLAQRHSSAC